MVGIVSGLKFSAFGFLTLLGATGVFARTTARPTLQQMDVYALQRASDVQVSPDGSEVAYVRMTPNVITDKSVPSIWVVHLATGVQIQLVEAAATSPRWSPDGSKIAYLAFDPEGKQQIYVVGTGRDAKPRPLTQGSDAPGGFAWSKDGSRIAFVRNLPEPDETLPVSLPPAPLGAQWAPKPRVVLTPFYNRDGSGFVGATRSTLFVVSIQDAVAHELPIGHLDVTGRLQWRADGSALLFIASPTVNSKSEAGAERPSSLYEVSISGADLRKLTTDRDLVTEVSVSRDGDHVAYLRHDSGLLIWHNQLWTMDWNGTHTQRLQAGLDRYIYQVDWSSNRGLIFSYGDGGETVVAGTKPDGSADVMASHVDGAEFSLSSRGEVGFAFGAPDRPAEVGLAKIGERQQVLTHLNARLLDARSLAKVETFDAPSPYDGQRVPGFVMLPPGYVSGKRYPTILYIHGGPWGDEGPQWHVDLQLLAAAGYVVLYANPRGSTSYGLGYISQLPYAAPQHDYDDLMGVVDAAVSRGIADPARLYVTGSSYGAEMTTWIVGRTNRFRAAAAEKPAVNFAAADLQNDQYHSIAIDPRGLPWKHPDAWWNSSPISLVGNVATPTMLIAGEDDRRTPPGEAQQFYNALQLRHIPSALVLYPGASHGSLGVPRSQMLSLTAHVLAWFARYR